MDQFRAKPPLHVVLDLDESAYRGNGFQGILDAIDASRLSEDEALEFMEAFVNPQLLTAWRDLRARFDVVEVSVMTAKHKIAVEVIAQGDAPIARVLFAPHYVVFDPAQKGGRDYLCRQVPYHPTTHAMLAHLGWATWALGRILGLGYAPRVWIATGAKDPALLKEYLNSDARTILFDDHGAEYAARNFPSLRNETRVATILDTANILPVPACGLAQWDILRADWLARWMLAHGLVPRRHPLFRDGKWQLAEAVREAQAAAGNVASQLWATWLIH